jgi:putative tricarboxylic transport membrane protein
MLLSAGSMTIFWSNSLVGSIVTLALVILCWPLAARLLARFGSARPREA